MSETLPRTQGTAGGPRHDLASKTRRKEASHGAAWGVTVGQMVLRNVRRTIRSPELIMYAVIQPVLFVLMFVYVLGGAMGVTDYKQFLLPGIAVQMVLFGAVAGTAVGMATDSKVGLMDRFRSMPIGRSPIIIGRTVAELVRALFAIVAMVVISLIVGFRFHGTFLDALIALAVLLAFAFSMSWLAAFIGLMSPGPEAAQGLGTIWLYPFSFISSAFVPTDTMPDWLRWFADYSPMTTTVNATRALVNGVDPGSSIWVTLIWCSGALAVSVPLAIRAFGSEK